MRLINRAGGVATASDPEDVTVEETDMKRADSKAIPLHDYGKALRNAVSWLGDRYLLAEPVRRRKDETASYYVEPRRWHVIARQQATS
jgi:hypothetical protein